MMKFLANRYARLALLLAALLLIAGCSRPAPKAVQAVQALAQGQSVRISWQRSEGAESYRILRAQADKGEYRFLCDTDLTAFTDTSVEQGNSYVYSVRAINAHGQSAGVMSEAVRLSHHAAEAVPAIAPVIRAAVCLDEQQTAILLEAGAGECRVYRAQGNEPFQPIGISRGGVFYDGGVDMSSGYRYKVEALETGLFSQEVSRVAASGEVLSLPVLMYHEFVTEEDLAQGIALDEYAIYSHEFEADLQYLKEQGYTTITTAQLVDYLEGRIQLPQKCIMLSIDDGKYGVYKRAWPLLKQYSMTAVLSLIGSEIDAASANPQERAQSEAPYCTWQEVSEMANSGNVEMISHTYDLHLFRNGDRVGACPAEDETAEHYLPIAQMEWFNMNKLLQANIGAGTVAMAYPFSKRSEEADKAWLSAGVKLLLAGNDPAVSPSRTNKLLRQAGLNPYSAVLRRVARMRGDETWRNLLKAQ